ncbi:MAG: 50S ribosomal protein L30 [Chloroflexi bacterium]|nr:50S ribosomal protein L30 [Chloroflexota bacterium]
MAKAKAKTAEPKKLQIKYVKSSIGYSKNHKRTIEALGLTRLNQVVVQKDTPSLRGMLLKVNHLVEVSEVEE